MKKLLIELVREAPRFGLWLGVSVLTLLGIVGCSSSTEAPAPPPTEELPENTPAKMYHVGGRCCTAWDIAEFHLKDGTRCVVVGGNTGRGIACQWPTSPVIE